MATTQLQVPAGLSFVLWAGPATAVANLPFAGSISTIQRISPNGKGYVGANPNSPISGQTKLETNGIYIAVATEAFDVDESLISLVYSPVLTPVTPEPIGTDLLYSYTNETAGYVSIAAIQNDVLHRTLVSHEWQEAGPQFGTWDGLNDAGAAIPNAKDVPIIVTISNVEYEWQGVIGNTSIAKSGPSVYTFAQNFTGIVSAGNYGYVLPAYSEGVELCYNKFHVDAPNVRIPIGPYIQHSGVFGCTDQQYVYIGGSTSLFGYAAMVTALDVTNGDQMVQFPSATALTKDGVTYYALDLVGFEQGSAAYIRGMAVQQQGNMLLVAHQNGINVLHKRTGAAIGTIALADVRHICLLNDSTLWLIHGSNNTIEQYTLSGTTITPNNVTAAGPVDPVYLAINPSNGVLCAIDGSRANDHRTTARHQWYDFNGTTGALIKKFGRTTGYNNDTLVYNDKFCFINGKAYQNDDPGQAKPFVAFRQDGKRRYIGDLGILRMSIWDENDTYVDQVAIVGYHYSGALDANNRRSYYINYLEFELDYPELAWRPKRWMGAGYNQAFDNDSSRMYNLLTMPQSGRQFWLAFTSQYTTPQTSQQLMENTSDRGMISTGVLMPTSNCKIFRDGSLWTMSSGALGEPATWDRQELLTDPTTPGQYPTWSEQKVRMDVSEPVLLTDPISADGYLGPNEITDSGILVTFSRDTAKTTSDRGIGYHLGGIKLAPGVTTSSPWTFRTSNSAAFNYKGTFPTDGSWENGGPDGNKTEHGGKLVLVAGNNILWQFNGEKRIGKGTNKWQHYIDNGQMVGQFGVENRADYPLPLAAPGLATNGTSGGAAMFEGDLYIVHNDEGGHAASHRWRAKNLASIKTKAATLSVGTARKRPGTALLGGLPLRGAVVNGDGGWTLSPPAYVAGSNEHGQWEVFTGRYETSKRELSFSFHPFGDNPVRDAVATYPLPTPATAGAWAFTAEACRFLFGGQNQDADFAAVQVLDTTGKVIVSIGRKYAGDNLDYIANGAVAGTHTGLDWVPLMFNRPGAALGVDADGRLFTDFADFPRFYPAAVAEAGADATKPAKLRVIFHTTSYREYGVSLTEPYFVTGVDVPSPLNSVYSFVPADATLSRVNVGAQQTMNVSSADQLKTLLAATLSNKKIVVADGTYTDNFVQTGAWDNVWLTSASGNTTINGGSYSVLFIFQGAAVRSKVRLSHIKFNYTGTGTDYALLYWNELGTYNGLEIDHCTFSCPNADVNALGCSQYSTSSEQGGIAKDVYIHDNSFPNVGRIAIELLNQGYDQVRLTNLRIDSNTFGNLGLQDARHGMAISLSGLIQRVGIKDNISTGGKYCIYELVNALDVIAENNSGMSQDVSQIVINGQLVDSACSGWSISKDENHPPCKNIYITGGALDVAGRPIQIYDAISVTVDGTNKLWKGHRGVQMNLINSLFKNLNILVQSTKIESSFEVTSGSGNTFQDSTISSAGSAAAGFMAAYESLVARNGTSGNVFKNLNTILGLQANGQPYAPSPATGSDGRIVNQGTNNTITNNTYSVAA